MGRKDEKKTPPLHEISEEWRALLAAAHLEAGTATIWRKVKGRAVWLETVAVAAIADDPHEYLKEAHGGGEFRIRLKNADGQYVPGSTVTLQIAGPPIEEGEPSGSDERDEYARLLARLDNAEGSNTALILAMIQNRPEPFDPTALVAALAPLIAPLLERREPPAPTPPPTMLEQVETLTGMMGLAQQMGGNDSGGFASLAKAVGPPMAKLVDAHLAQGNPPETATTTGPGPVRPAWFPLFEAQIPSLLGWARGGKDPLLRADFVLDELAPEQVDPFYRVLTAEGFRAEFYEHVPPAAEMRPWFDLFFDRIVAGITFEEGETDGEPAALAEPAPTAEEPGEMPAGDPPVEVEAEPVATEADA